MRICAWCSKSLENKRKNREFCDLHCYKQFVKDGPKVLRSLRENRAYWHNKYHEQDSKLWAWKKLLGLV